MGNNASMPADDNLFNHLSASPFKLGAILVDPKSRTVSGNGHKHNCEPKVFDLLIYFCQKSGEIITRDMLLEDIWQGRVVSDNAINRKIYQLRKLLSQLDDAEEYLETIPKFGYRLTMEVTPAEQNPSTAASSIMPNKKNQYIVVVLLLFLLTLMVFNLLQLNQSPDEPLNLTQLTALNGMESNASLSPNGQHLLFSHAKDPTKTQLILKHQQTDEQITLTDSDDHDIGAVWHPSGKQIAFVRINPSTEPGCDIYRLDITTKAKPEKLVACSRAGIPILSWSDKANQLFYAERAAKNRPFIIYAIDTEQRTKKQLTQPPQQDNFSGDFFITRNLDGSKQTILRYLGSNKVSVNIHQSDTFELLGRFELPVHINDIAWSPDEKWFYYRQGQHIKRVNAEGQQYQTVFHVGKSFQNINFSSDGKRLVMTTRETDTDIWQFKGGQPESFIGSTKKEGRPRYANNGKTIAFLSDQSGTLQFWLRQQNGQTRQLSHFDFELNFTWFNWSPDDSRLLFEHQESIYSLSLKDSTLRQYLKPEDKAYFAAFSSDNQSIYYGSNISGDWQIHQLNLADNSKQQLTFNGGYSAFDNPVDGQLYYSKYHHDGLWRRHEDGSERQVIDDFSLLNWLNWSIHDNKIIYAKPGEQIMSFDLADRSTTTLMTFGPTTLHDYSISTLNGDIVFTQHMSQSGDVLALEFAP